MGKVTINRAKVQIHVGAMAQKAALRGADRYRERVREEILSSGRIDTGEMYTRIDIAAAPPLGLNEARAQVTPRAKHFLFQDQGTKGHTMPKGRVMVFRGKRGITVFTHKVRGVKAGEFLRKARLKMKITDFV